MPGGAGRYDARDEPPDDAELLRRHAAGDPDAFGVVVARHRDRLWAVALRTLGDPDEAADALQDALVSALRASARGSFREESAVTTWLHRIVVNACLDRVRRRRARPTVGLADEDPDDEGARSGWRPARAVATVPDPSGAVDTALVVHAALRALPPEQAAAVVLVDLEGWSVAEAATALEVAPGTVKSRCARGRARMLTLLADVLEDRTPRGNRAPTARVPLPGTSTTGAPTTDPGRSYP